MTTPRIRRPGRVFIDSSAFFALANEADASHQSARDIATTIASEHWRTFTSNLILPETHALLLSRVGRGLALRVLQGIDRSSVTVVRVTPEDERLARSILVKYGDKDFSLTGATSFAVMERLSIPHAFTFDSDFHQYGFEALKPT